MLRSYGIDDILCRETTATAIASDSSGHFICLGGARCMTVVKTEEFGNSPYSIKFNRSAVDLLRWQRLLFSDGKYISSAGGQYVDVFAINDTSLLLLCSVRAHPLNITDTDWSAHQPNVLVTCSIDDSVCIWDIRHFASPCKKLNVVAGAEQAKWSPLAEHLLCTAHGTDIRIWDTRNLISPLHSLPSHLMKICCLEWHPTDPRCFVTTSLDCYMKMWDLYDLSKPRRSVGVLTLPIWKIRFSIDGDEFASIPLPPNNNLKVSFLNIWRTSEPENQQVLKCDSDVVVDICWQRGQLKRRKFKCLYSLSRSGKLRRYPITPSEVSMSSSSEQVAPLTPSTGTDGDRNPYGSLDNGLGSTSNLCAELASSHHSGHSKKDLIDSQGDVQGVIMHRTCSSTLSATIPKTTVAAFDTLSSSLGIPTSPKTDSDWRIWLSTPNLQGGMRMELEALQTLHVDGLTTGDINATTMSLSLTYEHSKTGEKINFLLRFHPAFPRTNKIYVEIVEQGSLLDREQAARLLSMLKQEAIAVSSDSDDGTFLSRVLRKLPKIIETTKIFQPKPIDIPRFDLSRTDGYERVSYENEFRVVDQDVKPNTIRSSPPYLDWSSDTRVPSPRTCGARFNGSGFLIVFGTLEISKRKNETRNSFAASRRSMKWLSSSENLTTERGRRRASKKGKDGSLCDENEKDVNRQVPRSLDEYDNDLVFGTDKTMLNSGHSPTPSHSPTLGGGLYCLFASAAGHGGMVHNVIPLLHRTNSSKAGYRAGRPSFSSIGSAASRSFSMQNVPLSLVAQGHRHRGSSLTGVLADDHIQIMEGGAPISTVTIYEALPLMSISKTLASEYRLLGHNALELCLWNRKVAEDAGRNDIVKMWLVLEQCVRIGKSRWRMRANNKLSCMKTVMQSPNISSLLEPGTESSTTESDEDSNDENEFGPWALHPFGRDLVNSLLDHFGRISDYQTAAVISCILSRRVTIDFEELERQLFETSVSTTVERSPSAQFYDDVANLKQFSGPSVKNCLSWRRDTNPQRSALKERLSNIDPEHNGQISQSPPSLLSSLFQNTRPKLSLKMNPACVIIGREEELEDKERLQPHESGKHYNTRKRRQTSRYAAKQDEQYSLLSPALKSRLEEIRLQYAEILMRWRMYSKAAEVLKFSESADPILPLKVTYKCRNCHESCSPLKCDMCEIRGAPVLCTICQTPGKGLLTVCAACHHGGHSDHIFEWFHVNSYCPSGCGCECKILAY
ncbi:hypothetical protein AB6A40_000967 [Gnathostoma spinigerum]|uniref:WDR59/RTC1-like RING zinc finger domain-containing protein n=1 Tax=Gnathostoma spinigerum TaxID=75299 RepID=A0ABD6E350_9BILA